ncbi:class E sortase [Microbacterium sp. MPKO10]|uniref:class E sortase n=1 Tax=Microbacterium sp. MPKO10 TaxID=2989818 RepID=UPI0022366A4E|nr:class E sortase [Microbacterium sp. MPKO10]MCW4457403.1 class E sortase [Microbacterium sp. MPKO10]
MVHGDTDAASRRTRRREASRGDASPRRRRKTRPRVTVVGVLGELLITAGVLILLFLFWQLWLNDIIVRNEQNGIAHERSQEWLLNPPTAPDPVETDDGTEVYEPIIREPAADTEIFGVMHIPRFGSDYAADVAGGVTRPGTLDPIGLGHYLNTQSAGEPGNFALAGHRTTYGKPLNQIAELRVGDAIVLQTEDGWYTYRFRTLEYVTPQAVDVLNPIPQSDSADVTDRFITLTACSPMFSAAERIVAYGTFESFTPTAVGPPASLTENLED